MFNPIRNLLLLLVVLGVGLGLTRLTPTTLLNHKTDFPHSYSSWTFSHPAFLHSDQAWWLSKRLQIPLLSFDDMKGGRD